MSESSLFYYVGFEKPKVGDSIYVTSDLFSSLVGAHQKDNIFRVVSSGIVQTQELKFQYGHEHDPSNPRDIFDKVCGRHLVHVEQCWRHTGLIERKSLDIFITACYLVGRYDFIQQCLVSRRPGHTAADKAFITASYLDAATAIGQLRAEDRPIPERLKLDYIGWSIIDIMTSKDDDWMKKSIDIANVAWEGYITCKSFKQVYKEISEFYEGLER